MLTIAVKNRNRRAAVDQRLLDRPADLRDAEIAEAQISMAVVDDPTIAKLHAEFLDDPDADRRAEFPAGASPEVLEGEVVVSADTARAVRREYRCTAEEELLRYVIHGTLHLVGYDDTTPRTRGHAKTERTSTYR